MSIDDPRPELDDIADDDADPVEAVETLFLSALLWGTRADITHAVALVAPSDFYRPVAAELFEIIAELVDAGERAAHDPATVLAELRRRGLLTGHRGTRRALVLELAVSAGAVGMQATHYGALVVAAAYRRAYRAAANGITGAADTLPEADLWDYMSRHGWRIRAIRPEGDPMTRPAPAVTIGAFRECAHAKSIAYRAVLEATGPAVVTRMITTATAAGHAVESSPWPDTTVGCVDLLDADGEIVGDMSVPTEASWLWWSHAAELHATESDCPQCAPTAYAATYPTHNTEP